MVTNFNQNGNSNQGESKAESSNKWKIILVVLIIIALVIFFIWLFGGSNIGKGGGAREEVVNVNIGGVNKNCTIIEGSRNTIIPISVVNQIKYEDRSLIENISDNMVELKSLSINGVVLTNIIAKIDYDPDAQFIIGERSIHSKELKIFSDYVVLRYTVLGIFLLCLILSYTVFRKKVEVVSGRADGFLLIFSGLAYLVYLFYTPGMESSATFFQIMFYISMGLLAISIVISIINNFPNPLYIILSVISKLIIFIGLVYLFIILLAIYIFKAIVFRSSDEEEERRRRSRY
ncbi:MAG: hypothetical protein IKB57_00465 [Bacteroidaceae bacterium]|nr:hypothetical protein [Bacteroidaceae bacterium]